MEIIARAEAQRQGLRFFFTGVPCRNGHIDVRYVTTRQCVPCKRAWQLERKSQLKPVPVRTARIGFVLRCHVCSAEVVLDGISKGTQGAKFCRIGDSFKERVYCSGRCQDAGYRRRANLNERVKARRRTDPEYRKRQNAKEARRRATAGYAEKHRDYYQSWLAANKEKVTEYKRQYIQSRRENDLNFRLVCALRHRVKEAIKHGYKSESTLALIGCSIAEVRAHIESQFQPGMSWETWGSTGWHIDHIRPCASFDLTDPEQQRQCFHYSNLQPLWASQNCSKGAALNWQPL